MKNHEEFKKMGRKVFLGTRKDLGDMAEKLAGEFRAGNEELEMRGITPEQMKNLEKLCDKVGELHQAIRDRTKTLQEVQTSQN